MFKRIALVFALAMTAFTSGCTATLSRDPASSTTPTEVTQIQQQPAAQQQSFGANPQGFVANPSDPNRGFVSVGGSMIPVVRGPTGWTAESGDQRRRNIMNSTPDRFEPMVTFLESHNLSLRDWHTLGEAYTQTEVTDQAGNLRIQYLRSLNEVVQNQPPANLEAAVQNAKSLRSVLNQFSPY